MEDISLISEAKTNKSWYTKIWFEIYLLRYTNKIIRHKNYWQKEFILYIIYNYRKQILHII